MIRELYAGKSDMMFRLNNPAQNDHLKNIMKLLKMAFSFRYTNEILVEEPAARDIGPGVCSSSNSRQSLNPIITPTAEHVNSYIDQKVC